MSVRGDAIRVRYQDPDSARLLARRLLRSLDVRSVTLDTAREEATIRLRHHAAASKLLGDAALLARQSGEELQRLATTMRQAANVVSWTDEQRSQESYIRAPRMTPILQRPYAWLLGSRFTGPLLRDWHAHRGVRPGVKTKAVLTIAATAVAALALAGASPAVLVGLASCATLAATCVLRLRVIRARR